jgi:hypothetical protein
MIDVVEKVHDYDVFPYFGLREILRRLWSGWLYLETRGMQTLRVYGAMNSSPGKVRGEYNASYKRKSRH